MKILWIVCACILYWTSAFCQDSLQFKIDSIKRMKLDPYALSLQDYLLVENYKINLINSVGKAYKHLSDKATKDYGQVYKYSEPFQYFVGLKNMYTKTSYEIPIDIFEKLYKWEALKYFEPELLQAPSPIKFAVYDTGKNVNNGLPNIKYINLKDTIPRLNLNDKGGGDNFDPNASPKSNQSKSGPTNRKSNPSNDLQSSKYNEIEETQAKKYLAQGISSYLKYCSNVVPATYNDLTGSMPQDYLLISKRDTNSLSAKSKLNSIFLSISSSGSKYDCIRDYTVFKDITCLNVNLRVGISLRITVHIYFNIDSLSQINALEYIATAVESLNLPAYYSVSVVGIPAGFYLPNVFATGLFNIDGYKKACETIDQTLKILKRSNAKIDPQILEVKYY